MKFYLNKMINIKMIQNKIAIQNKKIYNHKEINLRMKMLIQIMIKVKFPIINKNNKYKNKMIQNKNKKLQDKQFLHKITNKK